ncbi:hypothetical protein XENOCAPTIV_009142 [Xenoophorus captivus]|uniref:Uncharacterized protein n=1 Tax=Xenoophorus captivus TaxID=1517983 RepID=A0ABV0RI07_9TELE
MGHTSKPLVLSVSRGPPEAPRKYPNRVLLRVQSHTAPFKSPLVVINYKAPNLKKKNNQKLILLSKLYEMASFDWSKRSSSSRVLLGDMIRSGLGPAGTIRECRLQGGRWESEEWASLLTPYIRRKARLL